MNLPTETLPRDLREFQAMHERIFAQHDIRFYSKKQIMFKLFGLIGRLAKVQRRSKGLAGQEKKYLLELFRWWLALCNLLRLDATEILWEKYPGVCPYCLVVADCSCENTQKKLAGPSLPHFRAASTRPATIKEWQAMFQRIYSGVNDDKGFEYAIFRIVEEAEEVVALMLPEISDVVAFRLELADLGARIFALADLLGTDLEAELLKRYRGVCPNCLQPACQCPRKWLD